MSNRIEYIEQVAVEIVNDRVTLHLSNVMMQFTEYVKEMKLAEISKRWFDEHLSDFESLDNELSDDFAHAYIILQKAIDADYEQVEKHPIYVRVDFYNNKYEDRTRTILFGLPDERDFYQILLPDELDEALKRYYNAGDIPSSLDVLKRIRKLVALQLGFLFLHYDKIQKYGSRGTLDFGEIEKEEANFFARELLKHQNELTRATHKLLYLS